MTKQQLIHDIQRLNRSATEEFLEKFEENELDIYLRRLLLLRDERQTEELIQPLSPEELFS